MKTINISNCEVEEIILVPNLPITVRYRLKDSQNNILYRKTALVPKESLPVVAQTVVDNFMARLLTRVTADEGLGV